MNQNPKFKIGERVYYLHYSEICSGEIESILCEKEEIFYDFVDLNYFSISEKFVSKFASSLKGWERLYKIDYLESRIKSLNSWINNNQEQIKNFKKEIEEKEKELKELIGDES